MTESALLFGSGRALAGIVAEPPYSFPDAGLPAVVFLNSGLIHHVGPNRLWVRVARQLASRGFVTLRFDLSGIGDSKPATDQLGIQERWIAESRAAMDALAEARGSDRFILIGNCSGASLAYATARADPRVVGVGLVNPPGRRMLRYHLRVGLSSRKSWLRLLHGRAKLPPLSALFRPRRRRSAASRGRSIGPTGLRRLAERDLDLLVVSCEWDPGYDFFHRKHLALLTRPDVRDRITLEVIPGANHEFTLLGDQERLVRSLEAWTGRLRDQRWRRQPQPALR